MKIAFLAPVEDAVPPKTYGGTETVICSLITELVKKGHQVTVFASGDSQVPCQLIPIVPNALRHTPPFDTDIHKRDEMKKKAWNIIRDTLHKESFDIVHYHWSLRFFSELPRLSCPLVVTFHYPVLPAQIPLLESYQGIVRFVCISHAQREPVREALSKTSVIYNGINTDMFSFSPTSENDTFFFIGRISPDKGVKEAIAGAKEAGVKLTIAAKLDPQQSSYYDSIKREIDGTRIQYIGELGMDEKIRQYQRAAGLLAPIQYEEPFGLVAIEAMACGTPVIGTRRGAFPELIHHGKTGFLIDSQSDLVTAIRAIGDIDRTACRKDVLLRFSQARMAQEYLSLYTTLVN